MLKAHFSYNFLLGKDMVDAIVGIFLKKPLNAHAEESHVLIEFRD